MDFCPLAQKPIRYFRDWIIRGIPPFFVFKLREIQTPKTPVLAPFYKVKIPRVLCITLLDSFPPCLLLYFEQNRTTIWTTRRHPISRNPNILNITPPTTIDTVYN
jgi:hypothetical protein